MDLVVDSIAPLAVKLPQPDAGALERRAGRWRRADLQGLVALASAWPALLPLASPNFLKDLPDGKMQRLWQCWQEIDVKAGSDFTRHSLDLVRLYAAERLGLEREAKELAARVAQQSPNWKETVDSLMTGLRMGGRSSPRRP